MTNSKQIIKLLKANGWVKCSQRGSHCQFKHPFRTGRVTVPHPKKEFPKKTVESILKQAGLKRRGV